MSINSPEFDETNRFERRIIGAESGNQDDICYLRAWIARCAVPELYFIKARSPDDLMPKIARVILEFRREEIRQEIGAN